MTVRRALRQLHRHLMLPGSIGLPIVAMLSIPLLVLLITAFPVYKKWWRGFRRWPRPMKRKGDGRRYVGDLHRLAGLWSLWFVTLIGVTGLWYLAEWAGAEAPDFPAGATAASSGHLDARSIDAIVEAARREMPDLAIRTIALEDDGIWVAGQASALLVRDRANLVLFDGRGRAGRGPVYAPAHIGGRRPASFRDLGRLANPPDVVCLRTFADDARRLRRADLCPKA
jgi:uncharacterized iron-regulated membrane protein